MFWRRETCSSSTTSLSRLAIHRKLVDIAGEPEATYMMERFSNRELAEQTASLRAELHVEFVALRSEMATRFAEVDAKFAEVDTKFAGVGTKFAGVDTKFAEVDTKFAELRTEMHQLFRTQTIWLVATMLTFAGIVVAALAALR